MGPTGSRESLDKVDGDALHSRHARVYEPSHNFPGNLAKTFAIVPVVERIRISFRLFVISSSLTPTNYQHMYVVVFQVQAVQAFGFVRSRPEVRDPVQAGTRTHAARIVACRRFATALPEGVSPPPPVGKLLVIMDCTTSGRRAGGGSGLYLFEEFQLDQDAGCPGARHEDLAVYHRLAAVL